MRDEWGDTAELLTLLRNGHAVPHAADKLRFALAWTTRHLIARPSWTMFSHLGLARIDRYVPSVVQSPYGVFLHGIEAWKPLGPRDRRTLQQAALLVANSEFTARAVARANPGLPDIAVCPLALPLDRAIAPSHGAVRDLSVLIVGRLAAGERYKGHDQLIAIWPSVRSVVPEATLVIAGDGDDAGRLRRLAGAVGVSDAVRFTGFLTRAELDAEYARAGVFALPSRGEGFGLVYLEAMAHGLACIGSVHDAAGEVIRDGETGLLVDPDDPGSLARAIVGLLQSPGLRHRLGRAGQERVEREFSYARFRHRLTSVLDKRLGAVVGAA
jgi:phosphatidylinositol alpha-1,6-mannosyltransferase